MAAAGVRAPRMETVVATTPEEVDALIERLERSDPTCVAIELPLGDHNDRAIAFAGAILHNTVVTSVRLNVRCGDPIILLGTVAFLGGALKENRQITSIEATGLEVPGEWRGYCDRNARLAAPPPTPPPAAADVVPVDEDVDLTAVPWAAPVDQAVQIGEQIGNGAMCVYHRATFRGVDIVAKRAYAMQNPELYGLQMPEVRQNVVRETMQEIQLLRKLSGHENIVGLQGVGYALYSGSVMPTCLCMEVTQGTLRDRIEANQVQFRQDLMGIICGLQHIHRQGLFHDVKPTNCFVGIDGQIKLGGFQLAEDERECVDMWGIQRDGCAPYYRPEVQSETQRRKNNIYALGVTAMAMLLRESPVERHDERLGQMQRAVKLVPEWGWLLERCMTTNYEVRPTIDGLKRELVHGGLRVLIENLSVNDSARTVIELWLCDTSDIDIAVVAKALKNNTQVTSVTLHARGADRGVIGPSIDAITAALRANISVQVATVTGADTPRDWRGFCGRNRRLSCNRSTCRVPS
eukprot:m.285504 g.285504  ORF g.285504 m.285504 type:complete len:521 (+) comp16205_c0_seq8:105-1667(+)